MINLTIWMNYPALYQGDLFRALVASGEVELQVVFAKPVTPERIHLGWENDLEGYEHRFLDSRLPTADAIRLARSHRSRMNIMNGIWTDPSFAAALVHLNLSRASYAIYSEASDPSVQRSAATKLVQRALGKTLAPRAAGVLSVSKLADAFYKGLGVAEENIYPFGYFTGSRKKATTGKESESIEVIFAGQIIHRKGIDLLVEAMLPLFDTYPNLNLSVIGSGEDLPDLVRQLESAGVTDRVRLEGVIPPDKIPSRLASADLLVLPSRWDGWGVVVNEAFSVGLPVVVSDRCGAADLVRDGISGYVFRSDDASDLRRCLQEFLTRKSEWASFRKNAASTGKK